MKKNTLMVALKFAKKTPFYVFDEQGFLDNYQDLISTFRSVYPKYQVSYSYKTNYTPYICELVKQLGGYAEVVSDMEYELAVRLGYSAKQIVYNGPAKGERLEEHIENSGILNIDNLNEAKRVCRYASLHCKNKYKVGLRINLDVGSDFISRFGFAPESHDLDIAVGLLEKQDNISLIGLHCHISRARGLDAWSRRVAIMLDAADRYIITGVPEYISLGSGMYGKMPESLEAQFGSNVPSYVDYAKAVLQPIAEHYKHTPINEQPIVFTEPGTTIVARYLCFVTKVLNIKSIRERNMATVDGSYLNIGEICTLKKLPISILHQGAERERFDSIDIMGSTCLEQDLVYGDYNGDLGEGDILVFENVGSYSIVSKPQFIKPNCPMIAVDNELNIKEIMREETFNDVFSKFVF